MTKISNQYSLTNVLFADTTNGRVGVNNVSPTVALDVTGAARISGGSTISTAVFSLTGNDGGIDINNTGTLASGRTSQIRLVNGTTFFGANDRSYQLINIGTSSTATDFYIQYFNGSSYFDRFRITSDGSIGINGLPNPDSGDTRLQINGGQYGTLNLRSTSVNASVRAHNPNGGLYVGTTSNHFAAIFTNDTERMRITSGGDTLFQFSSNKRIGIDYDYTGTYFYGFATNSNARQTRIICAAPDANAGISFETGASFSTASQKMLITSGGNVLIGTTSVAERLTVGGGIITFGTSAIVYIGARDGSVNYAWYAENASFLYFYNSGTASVTAQIARTTGVYTALSDVNKKKDFEESNIGLSEVLQLKPTLYRMKTDDESSSKDLGFIAQEVKELIPQAYSESGEGENKFIGLNQMPLIAALTKAIQQQQTQINELKALINA